MRIAKTILLLLFFILLSYSCGGGGSGNTESDNEGGGTSAPSDNQTPSSGSVTVLAANDLGMHCIDREYSVFSILPPFNVVNAQVLGRDSSGLPYILEDIDVELTYDAIVDSTGSVNSYSTGKTEFWQYAESLFGITLREGEGLTGLYMPNDDPQNRGAQPMEYNSQNEWFSAGGIPITPIDDNLQTNTFSLMRISASDPQTDEILGDLDIVVPVASETDCQNCHRTGGIAAIQGAAAWSDNPDLEVQSKLNILILHDRDMGTNLVNEQPVLCARCHYSPALDLEGNGPSGNQTVVQFLSAVMHKYHGELNGGLLFPDNAPAEETCYLCHPGNITQCQRGAMKTGGIECKDCHGNMLAVGGDRYPWVDLPACQSCHTGDAVNYLTGTNLETDPDWPFRMRQAYRTGDSSASPLVAPNKRFAENTDTLYRFSRGHGGVFCEGCHGSTHAIWPNIDDNANDNVASKSLQGYSGVIIECQTCHEQGSLSRTTAGPHGLHNVNDSRWYDEGHENYYRNNKDSCKACHGQDLTGTPLSKVPTARTFNVEHRTVNYSKGDFVRCDSCHSRPSL